MADNSTYKKAGSSKATPVDDKNRKEVEVEVPLVILGIHSNVLADADYTDGHSWITVTRDGSTSAYGLWPDDHPNVENNGKDTDIRIGMEPFSGLANRYFKLTLPQQQKLNRLLKENVTWRYTNTCASWASETYTAVTGEAVDADDYLGFETPRELTKSIGQLEAKQKTSPYSPKEVKPGKSSSF
jgi:hypothetical protein